MNSKLIIVSLLFLYGCTTQKQSQFSEKEGKNKATWIKIYKDHVFKKCLWEGLNIRENCSEVFRLDNSLPKDFPLGLAQYRYIDTIAQIPILAAKKDSTVFYKRFLQHRNEIERNELNGIPIVRHCLDFYTSNELDSIANMRIEEIPFLWK